MYISLADLDFRWGGGVGELFLRTRVCLIRGFPRFAQRSQRTRRCLPNSHVCIYYTAVVFIVGILFNITVISSFILQTIRLLISDVDIDNENNVRDIIMLQYGD